MLLMLSTSVACSSGMLAQLSAEPTACPAERLEISEARQPWQGPKSWTAVCIAEPSSKGEVAQEWFCSQLADAVFCSDVPPRDPPAP